MRAERLVLFINRIDTLYKYLRQFRTALASEADMKGVHTLWVYLLLFHPDGLTSAEIAELCSVDRSLVSREIEMLRQNGIVALTDNNGRRAYNSPVRLTERGREFAEHLEQQALLVQENVDSGITKEELDVFYSVTEKLCRNFEKALQATDLKGKHDEA